MSNTNNDLLAWDTVEQTVSRRFEYCVRVCQDRTAMKDEVGTWTYAQLNELANRIAWELIQSRRPQAEPVALFFNPSASAVACMMAVLKAGKFFVPLDPLFPQARNEYIINDSHTSLLMTNNSNISLARMVYGECCTTINIDDLKDNHTYENPALAISPGALAYLLYTSGSTGQPKGVLQNHRGMLHNAMRQAELMHFHPDDKLTMLYSASVMGTIRDVSNSLLNGAALHPFDIRSRGLSLLVDWLTEEQLSVFHTIPSVFRYLPHILNESKKLSSLRLVILGGEAALSTDFEIFRQYFSPECALFTGLGTTETGTIRLNILYRDSNIKSGIIPLGYPVRDMEIQLLDEAGERVKDGEIGEIAVQSPFLSLGYWEKPELTQRSFLPDPLGGEKRTHLTGDLGKFLPDGCLVHCGRKDFQVKVRGFRIETQEVESAILESGVITDAVVVGHVIREGETRLVAYVVPTSGQADVIGTLRDFLGQRLPDYMVPALFVILDALPTTPNGKVDRRTLPKPEFTTDPGVVLPPKNPIQEELVLIWKKVLTINQVGIQDDFFELGGDSLLATAMFIEIENRFGRQYPLSLLIENRTVEKLAIALSGPDANLKRSLVAIRPEGSKPPLFALPGGHGDVLYLRNLAPHLEHDRPLYGFQTLKSDNKLFYHRGMEEIAADYLIEVLEIQPKGPYYLAGHSFGGYVALEMARLLIARGERVAFLGLWDTYPPGPRRQAPLHKRLLIQIRNLQERSWKERFNYVWDRGKDLLLRASQHKFIRAALIRLGYTPANTFAAARFARYRYNPLPYPGKIILFKADRRPWYVKWDPMETWPAYVSGELLVRVVPGEHGSLLFEPHVRELARQFNECLLDQNPS